MLTSRTIVKKVDKRLGSLRPSTLNRSPVRPVLFVGSSTEGLPYAKALQQNLDRTCQVVLWSQGVFGLATGTLEDLVAKMTNVDFAALVITPDDLTTSRGKRVAAPRDNVLLELGIALGTLGRNRTFIVYDRSTSIKLPTDLAGVTNASFEAHSDKNAIAALGSACTQIELVVEDLGLRPKFGAAGIVDEDTHFRALADALGVVASNFLIQLGNSNSSLKRESASHASLGNYWYGINFPRRHEGSGRFSVSDLCERLADSNIVQQDLKYHVTVTEHGRAFVTWLENNGYRAEAFISPLGSWGKRTKMMMHAVEFFQTIHE